MPHGLIELFGSTQPLLHHGRDQRAGEPRPWLPRSGINRRARNISARQSSEFYMKLRSYAS
jgi:hypothetical protein